MGIIPPSAAQKAFMKIALFIENPYLFLFQLGRPFDPQRQWFPAGRGLAENKKGNIFN